MTAPCPTCARLAADAEILARLDWWAWWEKRRELAEHENSCLTQDTNSIILSTEIDFQAEVQNA